MPTDSYQTISEASTAIYTEKRSKFIATACPVRNAAQVKALLDEHRKRYYDARHICYAYMLGADRTDFRSNDDGEPSGTAGKPILRQINSHGLSDVLVMVVRYFGGIKLGTSGLIVAYKTAAAMALQQAHVTERIIEDRLSLSFEYPRMNDVMRILKEEGATIEEQGYDEGCVMTIRQRRSLSAQLMARLSKVETLKVEPLSE